MSGHSQSKLAAKAVKGRQKLNKLKKEAEHKLAHHAKVAKIIKKALRGGYG